MEVVTIRQALTNGDSQKMWDDIKINQQKILMNKRIKHRNFGEYSKHICKSENCPYHGLMISQGSWLQESSMHFTGDKNKHQQRLKLERRKAERKNEKKIIQTELKE